MESIKNAKENRKEYSKEEKEYCEQLFDAILGFYASDGSDVNNRLTKIPKECHFLLYIGYSPKSEIINKLSSKMSVFLLNKEFEMFNTKDSVIKMLSNSTETNLDVEEIALKYEVQEVYTYKLKEEEKKKGLSSGAIAGIVVGAVIGVTVFLVLLKKKNNNISDKSQGEAEA